LSNGEFLFREGDKDNLYFYGVLRGEISLVRNKILEDYKNKNEIIKSESKNSNIKQHRCSLYNVWRKDSISIETVPADILNNLENLELFRVKTGVCFGEMAIINKQARSATAFAVGDVDLFYLDTESFNQSFNV